ncbi:hypothetical protein IFM89_009824 [Coptis chinensis]|uniref:F-box protein n=1 Tax=Coptis chinensis TaxID=261450 RepID=A0A835I3I5_9MAGN|nr:hypothetical protein IFM89_009824 [Coptis chinensis]
MEKNGEPQIKKQRTSSETRVPTAGLTTGSSSGSWEGLSPEVLALIFTRNPIDEIIRSVPFVCKSWREVVAGSYCWNEIDIERWCRRCNRSDLIDVVVRKLMRRSNGNCRKLSAYKIGDAGFAFVANCGRCLKVLQMPMSDVTDKIVKKHAESLKLLTFLDISYCVKITCQGIEAFGKYCTSLVHLRRNMPLPEWQHDTGSLNSQTDDGEALVIADTMPVLCHLELGYGRFTDIGLDAILAKCMKLTHLDIIGCYGVKMEGDFEEKCDRLEVFKAPWDDEYADAVGDDGDGDDEGEEYFSDSSDPDSDSDSD